MQEMVLMTVKGTKTTPTLEKSAEHLRVPAHALDPNFGVVLVDPKRNIYTVRVEESYVNRDSSDEGTGPFSDPRIAPFGLPK